MGLVVRSRGLTDQIDALRRLAYRTPSPARRRDMMEIVLESFQTSTPSLVTEFCVTNDLLLREEAQQILAENRLSLRRMEIEYLKCRRSFAYFVHTYCWIKNDAIWFPFKLWPGQRKLCEKLLKSERLAVLKSRQIGISWLCLAYALWLMIFRPGSTILLFSLRLKEAAVLLKRLKGIYTRLPEWLKPQIGDDDNKEAWEFKSGSVARAFPANGGDSYTASFVLVDEADLIPKLGSLLDSVLPTIAGGRQIALVSRVNKDNPGSVFQSLFMSAFEGKAPEWDWAFLPWSTDPSRDDEWYQKQVSTSLAKDGTLDGVHGQYPATVQEAISASSNNKRVPKKWLEKVVVEREPMELPLDAPMWSKLRVYRLPQPGVQYFLGSDPAKGLPHGDDSTITVVDEWGAECAVLQDKLGNRDELPKAIAEISAWYNDAPVLVERNNHGEGTLGVLETSYCVQLLNGPDKKPGYYKSTNSRAALWDEVVAEIKERGMNLEGIDPEDITQECPELICDAVTHAQVASLERKTCKAPKNLHDDVSDAWSLAQWARLQGKPQSNAGSVSLNIHF